MKKASDQERNKLVEKKYIRKETNEKGVKFSEICAEKIREGFTPLFLISQELFFDSVKFCEINAQT